MKAALLLATENGSDMRIDLERVKVLHVEPGDVLTLTVPRDMSAEHARSLLDAMKRAFPEVLVAMLTEGAELEVVRRGAD